jgi:hypothetical protein
VNDITGSMFRIFASINKTGKLIGAVERYLKNRMQLGQCISGRQNVFNGLFGRRLFLIALVF